MTAQDLQDVGRIERLIEIGEQHLREVRQEGRKEGRAEGRAEGERALLTRLLTRRFGPLSKTIARRIERAGIDELERWGERVLDAPSLREVFAADQPATRASAAARSAKQPARTAVKTRSAKQPAKKSSRKPARSAG